MAHFFVKNYALIEHTADIGIRVKAKDLKGLFCSCAAAMFDIIAAGCPDKAGTKKILKIKQQGSNSEELLVNWLNELLFLSATKALIFSDFKINKLSETDIEALVTGVSAKYCRVKTEIKAATYHALKIERVKNAWLAEVIFDV